MLRSSVRQVIDHDKQFYEHVLTSTLDEVGGKKLNIISIMGPQSSGKSTLLNSLFGTSFAVMNNNERRQTTQGIWVSAIKSSDEACTLIFDVEGTDGRERGEDQDFERKSALFSLATSHVLLMNIWENSVGLYHAANMSLLRTILEVDQQITNYPGSTKTVILFIIRDYAGSTPKENISKVLSDDLLRIWDNISSSGNGKTHDLFSDHFELQFAFLPHKILQPDLFTETASLLRKQFFEHFDIHRSDDDMALCDFPKFASSLWKLVDANKELDLPTERELLAQHRCDEIIQCLLTTFTDKMSGFEGKIEKRECIDLLGRVLSEVVSDIEDKYLAQCSRYPQKITTKKFAELREPILRASSHLVELQLSIAGAKLQSQLNKKVENSDGKFVKTAKEAADEALAQYVKEFKDCSFDGLGLDEQEHVDKFMQTISDLIDAKKLELARDSVHKIRRTMSSKLDAIESPSFGLSEQDIDFWPCFWELWREYLKESDKSLLLLEDDIGLTKKSFSKIQIDQDRWIQDEMRGMLTKNLSQERFIRRLVGMFELLFHYDSDRLPRIWDDLSKVDVCYLKAKERVLMQVDRLTCLELPEDLSKIELIKEAFKPCNDRLASLQLDEIKTSLNRHFELYYVEAKRSAVASRTQIPPWIFLLLLILGWNEFMTILTSPFYLFIAMIFGLGFVVVRLFNLMPYCNMLLHHASKMIYSRIDKHEKIE